MSYSKKVPEDIKIKFKAISLDRKITMTDLFIRFVGTL